MSQTTNQPKAINSKSIAAVVATPLFLGLAPIFGKLAITAGADSFTLAALRTIVAVLLMWIGYFIFVRRYIYIYPAGLMGCIVIGTINGIGSLFYYGGLSYLEPSLVQLINGSYLAFAILLSRMGGQRADARTLLRVALAIIALILIAGFGEGRVSSIGVGLILGNALMFAGTVILSQYVVYEMPAPTAALYILTTMGVVVTMVWLAVAPPLELEVLQNAGIWIVALGLSTAASRLAIFASVKFLGGMQTAINAAGEMAVALVLSFMVFSNTSLTPQQWLGTAIMFTSILLIRQQDLLPHGFNPSALIVANMSSVQFQRIAFHRAFGTQELDNAEGTMQTLTTTEMIAIQRMMGAETGGIDPFPIGKSQHLFGNFSDEVDPTTQTQPGRSRLGRLNELLQTRPAKPKEAIDTAEVRQIQEIVALDDKD